ncbi:MAG TPA: peroxiredoxin-like family protein, partial [Chryseolinea sp.]|nr:peroxiredoxin-like family protein [Chryseolinea sp.]
MNLEINVKAPVFKVKDVFGRLIDLDTYRDKKVLIGFFRHAGCPFCNLRVHALSKAYEELQAKGLEMIFFFESKDKVILRSSFHLGVSPIPIISDPEKYWYSVYGLENSAIKSGISHITSFVQAFVKAKAASVPVGMPPTGASLSTLPAEFLIDKGLII